MSETRADRRKAREVFQRLTGKGQATYRPRRIDHFVDAKSLVQWLENHRLPVSDDPEVNITTMEHATGL